MFKKQLMRTATALFAGTIAATALLGQPADAAPAGTKTVTYQGRSFQVPQSWPVIDVNAAPTTCVRFDVSAVYLGSPPPNQDCPAGLHGRADALLLEPAPQSTSAPVTAANDAAQQLTSTASGIRATVTYHSDQAAAQAILTSAGLPGAVRQVTGRAAPAASAGTTVAATVSGDVTTFHGAGFDPCAAPSSSAMSAWKAASPYGAIGFYIGGVNRGCTQPNLTASWISAQAAAGWKFLPLYVGLQAPSSACGGCSIISSSSAASQGVAAANDAADQATALGLSGVVIYFDMEAYSSMNNTTALTFESAWTQQLHARGFLSGIYSSAASGIADLANHTGSYTMPDAVDFANWNNVADTADSHFSSTLWANHQRVHQYAGEQNETWGGTTINIDRDYLDISLGTSAVGSHSITVGDLNDDGKNDLIGLEPNGSVLYYQNTGAPGTVQWGTSSVVATVTGFTQIAVGDMNNDGKNDLVGLRANGDIYMYPNVGAAGSVAWGTGTLLIGQSGLTTFDIGDLDNDGKKDIVGRKPNSDVWFYKNVGAPGTVAWGTSNVIVSGITNAVISVGDLNNDGKNDLVTMDASSNITLFPGAGAAGTIVWGTSTAVYNGSGYDTFDVGDLNNDGKKDIVGRVANTGNEILNPNTGAPGTVTWGASYTVATNAPF